MGTHVPCSAQRGLRAFPSALENPEAVSSQTQRGRCAIPSPGIPPPFPRVGSRDALLASKGVQRCLQPAGLSQHGAAAQHRVSSTRFIAKAPEFIRHCNGCACVCVCVCVCVCQTQLQDRTDQLRRSRCWFQCYWGGTCSARRAQSWAVRFCSTAVQGHCPGSNLRGGAHNPHPPTVRAEAFS